MAKEKQYLLLTADLLRALQSIPSRLRRRCRGRTFSTAASLASETSASIESRSNLPSFPSSMATLLSPSDLSISGAILASLLHLAGTSASDSFFSSPNRSPWRSAYGTTSASVSSSTASPISSPSSRPQRSSRRRTSTTSSPPTTTSPSASNSSRSSEPSLLLQSASKSTINFYLSHTPSPSRGAIASSMSSLSTSSAAPAIHSFISRLSDTLRRLTSDLKPWPEMIDRSAISRSVSLSKATSCLRKNLPDLKTLLRIGETDPLATCLTSDLTLNPNPNREKGMRN